jgi:hypothetical protein
VPDLQWNLTAQVMRAAAKAEQGKTTAAQRSLNQVRQAVDGASPSTQGFYALAEALGRVHGISGDSDTDAISVVARIAQTPGAIPFSDHRVLLKTAARALQRRLNPSETDAD